MTLPPAAPDLPRRAKRDDGDWWLPWVAAALVLAVWTAAATWVDHLYGDYRTARLRAQAAAAGASAAGNLANAVNQRLALVRGLAAFVQVKLGDDPKELATEFPLFASAVYGTVDGIRNISVAPDFTVRLVYPTDPGNLRVIGNNILTDKRPGFAEAVRRAVERRGMAVHEPVALIQGGAGLIARHAIFDHDKPWGAVGMVFSIDAMMDTVAAALPGFTWAVRSAGGATVGGDPTIFDQDPALSQVELPEGAWQLAVIPAGGWNCDEDIETPALRAGLLLLGGLLTATVWTGLRRRLFLEHLVDERTRDLTAANRELSQFAYATAHDLQEPLRSIASFSQLVQRDYGAALGEVGNLWLAEVVAAAKRMKTLLSDVQFYLAEPELPLPNGPQPAGAALEAALARLTHAITESGARIATQPLPAVLADHHRLSDVLAVLLANAIEFRSPERPPQITVSAREQRDRVVIDVADNGIGIEPAYQEKIFSVFQRLHGRDKHSGTGMGLAIARKMVERLGGRLTVRSVPGEGSVFSVELPAG